MLGWNVGVYKWTDAASSSRRAFSSDCVKLVVSWHADVRGLEWLDALVKAGQAESDKTRGGYPHIYQVSAEHIIPRLSPRPPEVKWGTEVWVCDESDWVCARNERLLIEAWDES